MMTETEKPAPRTWAGPLLWLGVELRVEAKKAPDAWHWYLLPGGAMVAAYYRTSVNRMEFRIGRSAKPADADRKKWEIELKTFERYLGLAGWERSIDEKAAGVAMLYREATR